MNISTADRSKGIAHLARLRRGKPASETDRELLASEVSFIGCLRDLRAALKKAGAPAAEVDEMLVFRTEQHRCARAVLDEREENARPGAKVRAKSSAEAWGRK